MSNWWKVFTVVVAIGMSPPVVEPTTAQTVIDGQAPINGPALIDAARRADVDAIRVLLAEGADVNARYGDGTTALHWAAHLDSEDLVTLLITSGADVNTADDHGVTALSLAALNGSVALVQTLLEAEANPNAAHTNGETVLMTAARVGNVDVVRLLLAPARISRNAPAIVWPPIGTSANYRGNVYVVIPPPLIYCACENLSATAFDRNCVRLDAATPL